MSYFDNIEAAGQVDIFEYLDSTRVVKDKRVKKFKVGDRVQVRFYSDEVDYINEYNPELLGIGEVVNKILDFYVIEIAGKRIEIAGEKLKIVK